MDMKFFEDDEAVVDVVIEENIDNEEQIFNSYSSSYRRSC